MKSPPAMQPGDFFWAVAPSGPFELEPYYSGLKRLSDRYNLEFDPSMYMRERYLAGPDARRLIELLSAFDSKGSKAVICARGGYGAMRLLSKIDESSKARNFTNLSSKPLVGFSDITALHCLLQSKGIKSIHGPVITQLGRLSLDTANELFELLENPASRPIFQGTPVVPGIAEGVVIGGNLSVLTRLIGTPFMPKLDDAILFFEDVGEQPYRLDRMWQHLLLSGSLDKLAGIAMGIFHECSDKSGLTGEKVLMELATERGLPAIIGLPIGHGDTNRPFPLGARARLNGSTGELAFLEGCVE